MSRKAVVDDPAAKKAALVLKRAYRRLKRKSWQTVADKYEVANKGRAHMLAHGRLAPHPVKDAALLRAVIRESDTTRAPVKMRRLIRKVAVPFLEKRQRSQRGLYGSGGRPL